MGWLKSREKRNREMEELGGKMVARPVRRMVARPVTRPVLQKMVARPSAGPQLAPSATPGVLRPTGFYAPAQAPGGYTATGPQAEGQSAATALVNQGIDWSLYAQALSDREKELLDTESESPWVTKRYLSAIERLKRDQFGDNMLKEEEALWNESYVNQFGFDDAQQWAYDKAHGGTRWGPRSMGGGYDTFGASRPSRYVPSERNALWWGRRGMNPPWEEGFGQDVVPHLCETEWGESDARCIQHLDDPYWSGQ